MRANFRPSRSTALLLAVLLGCGGGPAAGASVEHAEPGGASNNGGDVLLRLRVTTGAAYAVEVRGRMTSGVTTSLFESVGTLQVASVSEDGAATLANRIGSLRMVSADGTPLPGVADLEGVTFTSVVDPRGASVGDVRVSGTSPENEEFANMMRSSLSRLASGLPEEPVGPGDVWTDATDIPMPLGTENVALHCDSRYRLISIDASGAEPVAVVAVDGTCDLSAPMAAADGAAHTEIHSTFAGENRISLRDGLPRSVVSRSEMHMSITTGAGAGLSDLVLTQESRSTITPLPGTR